ncbi:MAG: polysaccharide deacetylase family protein [Oscillospiraceae bacterium]|nr:polysaccharide deacetylase family protein [Oscillospiraceae bacterium]
MKKVFFTIFACVLILAVAAAGADAWRFQDRATNTPAYLNLTLSGMREVFVEYGQEYEEPGATAQLVSGKTVTEVSVEIQGQVNIHRLGDYIIKYTAQENGLIRTDYRRIHVVDTTQPIISLVKNPDSYTLPNTPYQEEGFSASDNHDGDLTNLVVRTEADGKVTYTVTDSSGNTASITRPILYYDPIAPELTLLDNQPIVITAGDAYREPGYRAVDKYDGDITSAVTVTGHVDTDKPGVYKLRYAITNSFGNSVTGERTVYVVPAEFVPDTFPDAVIPTGGITVEPNGKVIYLTFDDGPSAHTGKLLDILAKYDVKASFFVVNNSYIHMIERTAREGHTVAIHSYSHRYKDIYVSDNAFLADIEAMQKVIFDLTGQQSMLMRFPGGSSNTVSSAYNRGIMTRLTKKLQEIGYHYFDWNVDSFDAGGARTAEEVFHHVISGIGQLKNSVVLQHDIKPYSVDAVERIIVWGLCNGYTFKPLSYDSPGCHHIVHN